MADQPAPHAFGPDDEQAELTRRLAQITDALRITATDETIAADSVNHAAVQQARQRARQLAAERDELQRRLTGAPG